MRLRTRRSLIGGLPMKGYISVFPLVIGLVLLMTACDGGESKSAEATLCSMRFETSIPFDDALVFIEFNSTDEDLGFHATFDFPGWTEAAICGPEGSTLFAVQDAGSTEKHGLSELFFEGAEPPLDEQPLDEFLARFPEGEYVIVGKTIEGDTLISGATFTHDVPDGPVIVSPGENEVVDPDAVVIVWEPVTSPPGIEIVRYEFFLAPVEPEEGDPAPELDIDFALELPATVTEVRIPPEFLMPGTEYDFEVLAIEVSGNKTITGGVFVTAGAAP